MAKTSSSNFTSELFLAVCSVTFVEVGSEGKLLPLVSYVTMEKRSQYQRGGFSLEVISLFFN